MMEKLNQLAQALNITHVEYNPFCDLEPIRIFRQDGKRASLDPLFGGDKGKQLQEEAQAFFDQFSDLMGGLPSPIVLNTTSGAIKGFTAVGESASRANGGLAYVLARMEELGSARSYLNYSGSNGSGDIYEAYFYDANDSKIAIPDDFGGIKGVFYDLLDVEHPNWETEGGGAGGICIDLTSSEPSILMEYTFYFDENYEWANGLVEQGKEKEAVLEFLQKILPSNALVVAGFSGREGVERDMELVLYQLKEDGKKELLFQDSYLDEAHLNQLKGLIFSVLDEEECGWENGGGAFGEVTLNLDQGSVDLCFKGLDKEEQYSKDTQWDLAKVFDYDPQRDGDLEDFVASMQPAPIAPAPSM